MKRSSNPENSNTSVNSDFFINYLWGKYNASANLRRNKTCQIKFALLIYICLFFLGLFAMKTRWGYRN